MKNSRPTQAQRVLDYIEQFGSITQHQASLDLGVARLASRISELKKRGHNIKGEWVKVKNRFGEDVSVKQYSMGGADDGKH
jgi:hypothetical protein